MHIRLATTDDLPAIVDIYNQSVASKFMTADTEPWVVAARQDWLARHTEADYPIYVAETDDVITGWMSISAYRPGRHALRFVKEVSCYVDHNYLGKGIGKSLLVHAILRAQHLQVKNYIAIVLDVNKPSITMLEKLGFKLWGLLPNIAEFDGIVCGHAYYGLAIGDGKQDGESII